MLESETVFSMHIGNNTGVTNHADLNEALQNPEKKIANEKKKKHLYNHNSNVVCPISSCSDYCYYLPDRMKGSSCNMLIHHENMPI